MRWSRSRSAKSPDSCPCDDRRPPTGRPSCVTGERARMGSGGAPSLGGAFRLVGRRAAACSALGLGADGRGAVASGPTNGLRFAVPGPCAAAIGRRALESPAGSPESGPVCEGFAGVGHSLVARLTPFAGDVANWPDRGQAQGSSAASGLPRRTLAPVP